MKTRFLKKKDHSAQFHYKIDEFHSPKILFFLTCKKNYFMNYSLYKTSPCAISEMSSLTCVLYSSVKLGMPFCKIFVWFI